MTLPLSITVFGEAQPQGSKRIIAPKGRRAFLVEDCEKSRPWRQQVAQEMLRIAPVQPLNCAVIVTLRVYVKRPASHFGTGKNAHTLKPSAPTDPPTGIDLDKIQRAVGDAGTGIWWTDDSRIAGWDVRRVYAQTPGVTVEAEPAAARTAIPVPAARKGVEGE